MIRANLVFTHTYNSDVTEYFEQHKHSPEICHYYYICHTQACRQQAQHRLNQCIVIKMCMQFLIPVPTGQNRPIVPVPFTTVHHHKQLHHSANLFSGLPKQSLDCWHEKWSSSGGIGSPGFMLNDVIHTQKDTAGLFIAAEEIIAQLCTFLSHFLFQSQTAQGPFRPKWKAWMRCSQGNNYVNEFSLTLALAVY